MSAGLEILTVAQMRRVDARAAELGVPGRVLMENAGRAVAEIARKRWPGRPITVACGPGANGGDGYVAARLLREAGAQVRVLALGAPANGDAAQAAQAWREGAAGADAAFAVENVREGDLVIDALFGAGLSRPLEGLAAAFALSCAGKDVLAVDVPSGLPGDGAPPPGPMTRAALTVTFVRKKPAHVLLPGRSLCGEVIVADIGAPAAAVAEAGAKVWENAPALWPGLPKRPQADSHKHTRGKVAVWARETSPVSATLGAQRLAARAAQRAGAGWVSVFCAPAHAAFFLEPASLVVRIAGDPAGHDATVFGCGAPATHSTAATVADLARHGAPLVLDAGALTSFEGRGRDLFALLPPRSVLTPHWGEFRRLFPEEAARETRIDQARAAAAQAGAVVILKGADTVIAAPEGGCAVNGDAPPWLASAGTGDVLAGMIGALLASGAPAFEAACAAVWLHGAAGRRIGPGLIADDLVAQIGAVIATLEA